MMAQHYLSLLLEGESALVCSKKLQVLQIVRYFFLFSSDGRF